MYYWSRKNFIFLLVVFVLGSCLSERSDQASGNTSALSVDSLLEEQPHLLKTRGASLKKKMTIDERVDSLLLEPDEEFWEKELHLFRILDLNKPSYVGAFDAKERRGQDQQLYQYELKAKEPLNLQSVRIEAGKGKTKITGTYVEKNMLFRLERHLTLSFEQLEGQLVLHSYSIRGFEKMIMKDTVTFQIEGEVL